MTALLTGLASLLVFGGVVLVHELGHFMAARHCGIHVEEFSIGFGPRLWAVQKNGTTYSLRLFPLGGYNLFSQPPEEDADPPAEESAPPPAQPRKPLFPLVVSGQSLRMPPPGSAFCHALRCADELSPASRCCWCSSYQGQGRQHDGCGFRRERHKPAACRKATRFCRWRQPCWTVYALPIGFTEEETQRGGPARRRGPELQDVTFTPTRDADGMCCTPWISALADETCGTSLS
ncbi:MAG: site-2 protease family protein [Gemmiger sp.]